LEVSWSFSREKNAFSSLNSLARCKKSKENVEEDEKRELRKVTA
jgi:hypothetical protein